MTTTTTPPALADDAVTPPPSAVRPNRPLWQLVLWGAAIIAVLWWLGGWPLPVVILGLLVMIMFHELGHFLTAKWTGMKASEFFVGFGPRLWSTTIGETEYGIKAGLLGGYVRIIGMTNLENVPAEDESRTFRAATFPRRVLVASAGSIMHVLMAIVLAWASFAFFGEVTGERAQVASTYPLVTRVESSSLHVISHHIKSPAQLAGLRVNETIERVNGKVVSENKFISTVQHSVGVPLRLTVLDHGVRTTLVATPINGHDVFTVQNGQLVRYVPLSQKASGILGVELNGQNVVESISPLSSVPKAFSLVWSALTLSLTHLPGGVQQVASQVTNSKAASNPKDQDERLVSIFGIARAAIDAAKSDPQSLLIIFMAINIGVGLINMLPMLPLDGGYVAVAIYERIRTRRGRPAYHADVRKLNPVVYAFVGALLVLFVATLYLDITHPISF